MKPLKMTLKMQMICVALVGTFAQSLPASAGGVEQVPNVSIYCPMKKGQLSNVKALGLDPRTQAVWAYTSVTEGVQLVTTFWEDFRCPFCHRFKVKTNTAELGEWSMETTSSRGPDGWAIELLASQFILGQATGKPFKLECKFVGNRK